MIRPGAVSKPTRGDLGLTFKTDDQAAVAACAYLWKSEPKATRREFCGVIYRDSDGIKAGLPEIADETYCIGPLPPPGTTPEAGYHNHTRRSDFSWYDRKYATALGRYLCAPNGLVMKLVGERTVVVK